MPKDITNGSAAMAVSKDISDGSGLMVPKDITDGSGKENSSSTRLY